MTSESALQVTPEKLHALEAGKVQSASWLLGSIAVLRLYKVAACCAARDPAEQHGLHSLPLHDMHKSCQIRCWNDNAICTAVLLVWQCCLSACACAHAWCNFIRRRLCCCASVSISVYSLQCMQGSSVRYHQVGRSSSSMCNCCCGARMHCSHLRCRLHSKCRGHVERQSAPQCGRQICACQACRHA